MIQKLGGRPEGVGDQGVDYVIIYFCNIDIVERLYKKGLI